MKRKMKLTGWIVAVAMVLTLAAARPCAAQMTWTVDTIEDVVDENDGFLSLREALGSASTYDTIEFDSTLLPGTIYLSLDYGTLFVDQDVTIAGPGPDQLTVDGQSAGGSPSGFPVFTVGAGYALTEARISGLTIMHGGSDFGASVLNYATLTLSDCTLTSSTAFYGGAVANAGTMTMTNCVLSDNHAEYGGAVLNAGTMTMTDCELSENSANTHGGAVFNSIPAPGGWSVTLTVTRCSLTNNRALTSGDTGLGGGGAICNFANGSSTSLAVKDSLLSGNVAQVGGAIANFSFYGIDYNPDEDPPLPADVMTEANVSVVNCVLTGNKAWLDPALASYPQWHVFGGAVAVWVYNQYPENGSATLTIDRSVLSDNTADGYYATGGAVYFASDASTALFNLTDSTLSGNSAQGQQEATGGALVLNAWPDDDDTSAPTMTKIRNCTLSDNFVMLTGEGIPVGNAMVGCIYNYGADLFIDNSTLAGNRDQYGVSGIWTVRDWEQSNVGGTLAIKNTILANDASGKNLHDPDEIITSFGHNICTDDSVGLLEYGSPLLTNPTDLLNTDPRLGPLADNGGPTMTHALLEGSPAIDAADSTDTAGLLVALDQRGVARPQGAANDIGAFELEVTAPVNHPPVLTLPATEFAAVVGSPLTFTATATDPDAGDALAFSLVDAPHGASIDPATGVFSWTPTAAGTFTFAVMVADAAVSDYKLVTINVSALAVTNPIIVKNGKSYTVTVTISNFGAATAANVTVTGASLDGSGTNTALPLLFGAIKPGVSKQCKLQFKNVPLGNQTFTVSGTCSLGGFTATKTVTVP